MKNRNRTLKCLLTFWVTVGVLIILVTTVIGENVKKPLWTPPHLEPHKSASPEIIWIDGSGLYPDRTTVTLTVRAVGDPLNKSVPADIDLCLDETGSMAWQTSSSDPTPKIQRLKEACHKFVNMLTDDDRAGVLSFNTGGIKRRCTFTNNKPQLHNAIDSLYATGGTPFYDALSTSVIYTRDNHRQNKCVPVVIAVTDGESNSDTQYNFQSCKNLVQSAKQSHNVTTYTIGLGTNVQQGILQQLAQAGGGKYYFAPTANDLQKIFDDIHKQLVVDPIVHAPPPGESMINDILPPYIKYVANSWKPTPKNNVTINGFQIQGGPNGTTIMRWDINKMKCGEIFEVAYEIKSCKGGFQNIGVNQSVDTTNYCRVAYKNYAGQVWRNATNDVFIIVKVPDLVVTAKNYRNPEVIALKGFGAQMQLTEECTVSIELKVSGYNTSTINNLVLTDRLQPYIENVTSSFNPKPYSIVTQPDNSVIITWKIGTLSNNTWIATYKITSDKPGLVDINMDTKATYTIYNGSSDSRTLNRLNVEVKKPGPPPTPPANIPPPAPPPPPPPPPSAPPGMPVLNPMTIPLAQPVLTPLANPILQGLVQPQILTTQIPQVMITPVTMPSYIGLVTTLGISEKVRLKRKLRAMSIVVSTSKIEKPTYIGE